MNIQLISKAKNMKEATTYVKVHDKINKYTESLTLETSSKMDANIYNSAKTEKKQLEDGTEKYNGITNNCADIVETVIENGTNIDLPTGISPKPNDNFDNIKEKKEKVQFEINKKRANEK